MIVEPIEKLTEASFKIVDGDLNAPLPEIKSKDEIQKLSEAIEMLVGAIKFNASSKK